MTDANLFMTSFSPARLHLEATSTAAGLASRCPMSFVLSLLLIATSGRAQQPAANQSPVLYKQGDPTDSEQYLLQQLNRARIDPVGEGQRLAEWLRNTPDGQAVDVTSLFRAG